VYVDPFVHVHRHTPTYTRTHTRTHARTLRATGGGPTRWQFHFGEAHRDTRGGSSVTACLLQTSTRLFFPGRGLTPILTLKRGGGGGRPRLAYTRYCVVSGVLCTNQYHSLRTHPLFRHPTPPIIAYTIAQSNAFLLTPRYCNVYNTILVMAISCKGQGPGSQRIDGDAAYADCGEERDY